MIKDVRNTFRQTAIYGVSNIMIKAVGLVLMPIYTSTLSTEDYGTLVMFEIITQFFVGVISLNLPGAFLRIGSDTENRSHQNKIYFTTLISLLVAVLIFLIIFLPLNGTFSRLIFQNTTYSGYFTIIFISIAIEILGLLPMQLLRLREKSTLYILFFGLKLLALIGFVWYFVSIKNLGVHGAIVGILLANIVLLIATLPIQIKNLVLTFDKKVAGELIRFGAPLIFTTVAGILLTISDRLIIKIYGQLSDVGIYTLAYKIGSVANLLVIGSFSLGFLPIAFKKFMDANFNRFYSKMFTYFIGITVFLTLVISLFSKEGIKVISNDNPDFWLAVILVPFIAYAFIFKALQTYLANTFLLLKRTKIHAKITVFGVILNIVLNFIFIPRFGIYGAIGATAISYLLMALYSYYLAQISYPVHYEKGRILKLLISCGILIATGIFINDLNLGIRLIVKTALCLIFMIYLYFGIADKVERGKVMKVWRLALSGKLITLSGKNNN